jgi:hypothetical protein
MKQILTFAAIALSAAGCEPQAAEPNRAALTGESPLPSQTERKCTSTPCANNATGEDPQDIAFRKARQGRDANADTSDDLARWKQTLYSDAKRSQDLQLQLVRAANLYMYLDPAHGLIRFTQPNVNDSFEIEQPIGTPNTLCPEYGVDVITAVSQYAVVRKSCMLHEYKPGRYSMGATYYIYDAPTHTMRTIWQSQTNGRDDPFPDPDNEPTVVPMSDGIRINWKATYPSEGKQRSLNVDIRYIRKLAGSKQELVCVDSLAPSKENIEVGACEGGALNHVATHMR